MGFMGYTTQKALAEDLIHEDIPTWSLFFKIIVGAVFGVASLSGALEAVFLVRGVPAGNRFLLLFAIFLPVSILVHAVMPRRYQIFADRVRIVLGYPLAFDIPMRTIKEARPGSPMDAFGGYGFRFVCSSKSIVHLDRINGWPIVISPGDRRPFLEKLGKVLVH